MDWSFREERTGNLLTDLHSTDFSQVADLYDGQDSRQIDTFVARAEAIAPTVSQTHRDALVDTLHAYMASLGAGQASMAQLERLRNSRSVAVVTGQQAGLFSGPLYTLYKAMSAVGLAKRLEAELDRPVVPVFWVASEDHDWGEVDHAYVLDEADTLQRIKLGIPRDSHEMVHYTVLPAEEVQRVLQHAAQVLPEGPDKTRVLNEIRDAYEPGMTMANWFAKIVVQMLEPHGLIVLDPCLPGLRKLVQPVWETAIRDHRSVRSSLDAAYAELEGRGFKAEVIRDEVNTTLFYVHDGKRYVLERVDDDTLRARGLDINRSVDEWLKVAEESPTSFSSNVLLRPVVQDALLPTLAYVGGPSELAYYPLSRGVFHAHGRKLPPLVLRDRLMLYVPSVQRNMSKWDVDMPATAQHRDVISPALHQMGGAEIERAFLGFAAQVEERWQSFMRDYHYLGAQVEAMAQAQIRRELAGLERLQAKTLRLLADRNETEVKQLRHIERWLWTDGHAQERRLCPLNIWTRFGLGWLTDLPFWGDFESQTGVYHVMM